MVAGYSARAMGSAAMSEPQITSLPLALRAFPAPPIAQRQRARRQVAKIAGSRPDRMLVFDFETRTDAAQAMTFGSYRYYSAGLCLEEGLIYADDLPRKARRLLERYVARHAADTARHGVRYLKLVSRAEFAERFFKAAYKGRCLVVGFNLPFDLSRLACGTAAARGRFAGGFSFRLAQYIDGNGKVRENKFRPRVAIKHIDSKRALKGFTGRMQADASDRIPDDSEDGKPDPGFRFRGYFLDLRTLAFALTDRSFTLDGACGAFGVEHGKQEAKQHGIIDEDYIDYNRRDVLATAELSEKLLTEYDRHPIALQATKAYSPASIGKAYLKAMGIVPHLERQRFPLKYLGYAQSAFYGGRTSAHIRKLPVPIVYCDFLSMYPTVNSNMGLWNFVIATRVRVVTNCVKGIEAFLRRVDLDLLFCRGTWPQLSAFVRVIPNGDILPTRAQYGKTNDWQVAINHVHASSDKPEDGIWYTLPDVVASVLLTGRIPRIVDAFRIVPEGQLDGLKTTEILGDVPVDPASGDFFRTVIEQRVRLSKDPTLSPEDQQRYKKGFKVLANATSYGIFAEMNRREVDEETEVTCYGIDSEPFTCKVKHPEEAGQYCFPPLAALITGGARLMLAMLERCVIDLGGTYAMEDTDSMAIVAKRHGGRIRLPGAAQRYEPEFQGVRALSWGQVKEISERFAVLSPYNRTIVPGSVLKLENDNYNPKTGRQRQLWCYAIAAKRYALFTLTKAGEPELLRKGANAEDDCWSEHGLGHLLNPTDPQSEDRAWIAQAWLRMIRRSLGLSTKRFAFEDRPAVTRLTISSPAVMRPFAALNCGKPYPKQIKPFNFILSCHVRALGHPAGVDPERFHLTAPYENDPRNWSRMTWSDRYSAKPYRITPLGNHGSDGMARVKTYGDVMCEYEYHAESKCADSNGKSCSRKTVGLLSRRHVRIHGLQYIGKEANRLEDVGAASVHSADDVYTEYQDVRRDNWATYVLPRLKALPLRELQRLCGLSRAALQAIRAGRRHHPRNASALVAIVLAERSAAAAKGTLATPRS